MTYEQKLVLDHHQIPYQSIKIQRLQLRIVARETFAPEKVGTEASSRLKPNGTRFEPQRDS